MENILYHYTSGEGLLGILKNKEFWASNVKYLNDPTEPSYFGEILGYLLKHNPKCQDIFNFFYNFKYIDDFYDDSVYIISFCQSENALTMWRNYAKGNGYNIGIDIRSFINSINSNKEQYDFVEKETLINNFSAQLSSVIYDKKEQLKILENVILKYEGIFERLKNQSSYTDSDHNYKYKFCDDIIMLKNSFKHHQYADEKETRLIIRYYNKKRISFRVSPTGVIIEYIRVPFTTPIIKSIMCHPTSTKLHVESVNNYLDNTYPYSIKVKRSKIPYREL